jgi:hypothetical protein
MMMHRSTPPRRGSTVKPSFEFRWVHGAGNFEIDNLDISASSITPVPEPVNVALGCFAVICLGVTVGRRFLARQT